MFTRQAIDAAFVAVQDPDNRQEFDMSSSSHPVALEAPTVAPRVKLSNYPEPFFSRMAKRDKRPLGTPFGLANFGVNLTRLLPGGESALRHAHTMQDEFIYVLEGKPTLMTDEHAQQMNRLKEMIVDARHEAEVAGVIFSPIINYPIDRTI